VARSGAPSGDVLDLMVGLKQRFGVEIPESDYARLVSLNDALDELQARPPPA